MAQVNPYVQVDALTARVGDRTLFRNVSFGIAERQKVALIARNGTGKTTLLNIIAGQRHMGQWDEGTVTFRNGLRVGYLEQEPHYADGMTAIEACLPEVPDDDRQLRATQILTKLGIIDHSRPIAQLSGGERKRVALAQVLCQEPDLLILDEPTNHLDLRMVEWLEAYLSRSHVTLLMVTHDRYFLDRVCNIILELDDETLYQYRGNYAYYLEKRQERVDARNSQIARANNLYRRELDWMRRQPQARGHKASYREQAFAELQAIAKQRIEERAMRLKVKSTYIGSKIFEAEYVSKAYGDKQLIRDFYYCFSRYEKLGIVGPNGAGKSTFIKMLLGEIRPDSGRFTVGDTVRFGYFSQEGLQLDDRLKVIDAIRQIAEYVDLGAGRHLSAMQFLQHFLFTPQQQQSYVAKLSGGEKRRLQLCMVLMQSPNFLVLDEPTNDLDIATLQLLEEYLQDFAGCVIVVSHDRYFLDRVVDHLLVMEDGRIKDFPGNYTQYRTYQSLAPAPAASKAPASPKQQYRQASDKRRLTYKEQQELKALEADIEALEAEKRRIEDALSSGAISVDDITAMSKRLPLLNEELDAKSTRWLELSEIEG